MSKSIYPEYKVKMPTELCRGINMGNALEAPHEGDWGWVIKENYFDVIKKAGFDHVRIPIRWSNHAETNAPYTIDKCFFDRIDWIVANALKRGLTVIINLHHYNELFEAPVAHKERFLKIWEQISSHYKDYPEKLYFEILNEPNTALTPELWNRYYKAAYAIIRKTNPQRYIVIDTALFGNYLGLSHLVIPENDSRVIVSFHFYVPWDFCFQGASWMDNPPAVGKKWSGFGWEQAMIVYALDYAVLWSKQHNDVVLWNGEYGTHHWADLESRVLWTRFVTREAEKRGIANAIWGFHNCDSAGFYDPGTDSWIEEILQAVIPVKRKSRYGRGIIK